MNASIEHIASLYCKRYRAVALFLIAALLFVPTVGYDFTFDDHDQVLGNPLITSLGNSLTIFQTPLWPGDLYRPLTTLSFAVNYAISGFAPSGFHLTNVVLHALVCLLVFLFLRELFSETVSWVAALLFAVHPLHVEVVANVWNRSESLAALGGLLSMLIVLRTKEAANSSGRPSEKGAMRTHGRRFLAALIFLGALFSKESAIVFLPLLVGATVSKYGRTRGIHEVRGPLALFSCAAVVYLSMRYLAMHSHPHFGVEINYIDNFLKTLDPAERLPNAIVLLGLYLIKLFAPYSLHADYSFACLSPVSNWLAPEVLMRISLVIAAVLSFVVLLWRGNKLAFLGFWLIAPFAVTGNVLFPIGTAFAERLAYTPSIAACGFIAVCAAKIRSSVTRRTLLGAVILLYGMASKTLCQAWSDDFTLWQTEVAVSPLSVRSQHSYAWQLFIRGDFEGCILHELEATRLYPEFLPGQVLLQRAYQRLGRFEKAEAILIKVLDVWPDYPPALDSLGWVNIHTGNSDNARGLFLKALAMDGSYVSSQIGLFAIAVMTGDFEAAEKLSQQLDEKARRDPRFIEFAQRLAR